jgi:hypothetical protein
MPPLRGWPSNVTDPDTGKRLTPPQPIKEINPKAQMMVSVCHRRRRFFVAIMTPPAARDAN